MTDETATAPTGSEQDFDPRQQASRFYHPEMFLGGRTIYAGITLGVFDLLADNPIPSSDVADKLELDPDHSYRLLRALASLGLMEEDETRRFSLNPVGKCFSTDHPQSIRAMILAFYDPEILSATHHLPEVVREGGPDGFVREHGAPAFEYFEHNPELGMLFGQLMDSFSKIETDLVLDAVSGYDFSEFSHVCDIGGRNGHLLCSLLQTHPHLEGTVLDLPPVIEQTDQHWAPKLGVDDRCTYVGGDMFEEVPAADGYIMKKVLHDWTDEDCVEILSNIHEAATPGARLFIVEDVLPGPETPHQSKLWDLQMMLMIGGRERTESEFDSLLEQSGWQLVDVWDPDESLREKLRGAEVRNVIEATKA